MTGEELPKIVPFNLEAAIEGEFIKPKILEEAKIIVSHLAKTDDGFAKRMNKQLRENIMPAAIMLFDETIKDIYKGVIENLTQGSTKFVVYGLADNAPADHIENLKTVLDRFDVGYTEHPREIDVLKNIIVPEQLKEDAVLDTSVLDPESFSFVMDSGPGKSRNSSRRFPIQNLGMYHFELWYKNHYLANVGFDPFVDGIKIVQLDRAEPRKFSSKPTWVLDYVNWQNLLVSKVESFGLENNLSMIRASKHIGDNLLQNPNVMGYSRIKASKDFQKYLA